MKIGKVCKNLREVITSLYSSTSDRVFTKSDIDAAHPNVILATLAKKEFIQRSGDGWEWTERGHRYAIIFAS